MVVGIACEKRRENLVTVIQIRPNARIKNAVSDVGRCAEPLRTLLNLGERSVVKTCRNAASRISWKTGDIQRVARLTRRGLRAVTIRVRESS